MALIAWMLESATRKAVQVEPHAPPINFKHEPAPQCVNGSCITRHESSYLHPRFSLARNTDRARLMLRCDFCERELRVEFIGHASARRYYRFDENLYGYVRQWIEEGTLAVFETVKQAEESGYEPYRRGPQREIMNAAEIARACDAMASQVIADTPDFTLVSIVGVVSRGALLAMRMGDLIEVRAGVRIPCAALDVYGGDTALHAIDGAENFNVDGRTIILVDDVINSGWTIQRAMTMLWRHGRPAAVKLAVLIDRGHRMLPIRPNYVGKSIPTARADRVQVRLATPPEANGPQKAADRVVLYSMVESMKEAESAV
jgi:pyrimidine operon attenuation protein/uracil phosphoribosyltransferase